MAGSKSFLSVGCTASSLHISRRYSQCSEFMINGEKFDGILRRNGMKRSIVGFFWLISMVVLQLAPVNAQQTQQQPAPEQKPAEPAEKALRARVVESRQHCRHRR